MNPVRDQLEQPSNDIAEKDIPLREDIRQLGRLLGETVHAQEGQVIFDLVENIRQRSIRFHRDDDTEARRIVRGGSWASDAFYIGVGVRSTQPADEASPYVGFRCVMDVTETNEEQP